MTTLKNVTTTNRKHKRPNDACAVAWCPSRFRHHSRVVRWHARSQEERDAKRSTKGRNSPAPGMFFVWM